ncbi:hypothetical protein BC834DRAFT_974107 [Gloeopeniophorella convolvens]|nr:hypothetical protein BC834DRAFT_974107 [Gloeopeniophorella convolvens]
MSVNSRRHAAPIAVHGQAPWLRPWCEWGDMYKKAELKSFLQFHRRGEESLRDDEISTLNRVLVLNTKSAEAVTVPMKARICRDIVTIRSDTILKPKTVGHTLLSGYPCFPIHEPDNPLTFVGLLSMKKAVLIHFRLSILPEAELAINCFQALDYLYVPILLSYLPADRPMHPMDQTGRAHLLLVSNTTGTAGGAIGVTTLEDNLKEIISEEIVDEMSRYEDNRFKWRAGRMTMVAVVYRTMGRERQNESASTLGLEVFVWPGRC